MIEILPLDTKLKDISEHVGFMVEFSYSITPSDPNESYDVLEFKITAYDPNTGVVVGEKTISGEYKDSFTLESDSIKYITKDLQKKTASSFEDLPDPKTADLYYFRAPSKLERDYSYSVYMRYRKTVTSGGGTDDKRESGESSKPSVTEHEITKKYTQKVFGNWDVWSQQLRDYVKRGI